MPLRLCTRITAALFAAAGLLALATTARAGEDGATDAEPEIEIFGEIEFEGTLFFEEPKFAPQKWNDGSVASQMTFQAKWWDGDLNFRLTPFARIDAVDDRRTHFDVREAKIDLVEGNWSFTVGIDTLFWGKTEVVHLVDIINQADAVEDIDNEARLGQPLVRVAYLTDFGEFSAFYMPYFRERTFPGPQGRLRLNPAVDTNNPIYDTDAEEWTPSFAMRYTGVFGDVDLGISAFHGLGREPAFLFDGVTLRPFYERITQVGLDAQYTSDATLWKAEGIYRWGQKNLRFRDENYLAMTGGVEHTLYGVFDNADLGLVAEYAFDSRGDDALTVFENDLVLGTRLTLNDEKDTAALLTGAVDMDDGAVGLRLEAERRIDDNWKLELEGQAFLNYDRRLPTSSFSHDSFLRAKLTYYFGLE